MLVEPMVAVADIVEDICRSFVRVGIFLLVKGNGLLVAA